MTSGDLPRPPIPATTADLSPEWFSAALGRQVISVALDRLGGLSSLVHRARLTCEGHPGPPSVIVKLALPGATPAPGFDREVRFYRELAPRMDVAVPACLWSDADADTGQWMLVLEDFPAHAARSDEAFATTEQMRAILTEIARVHAAWWGSPELERHAFLRTLPDFIARVEAQLERGVPLFLERFAGRLDAEERAVFELLPTRFRSALEPLDQAPKTLVHHDLSLRNVLLGSEAASPGVVLIDWGLPQRTAPVRDVSFLIGTSVPPDRRTQQEGDYLRLYLDRLHEAGVVGYSFEHLVEDYRRSVICDYGRMVLTAGHTQVHPGMEAAVAHQLACRAGSAAELDLLALLQAN
ncbi:MAG: phosphotransferase [Dehalococcoidia bacterium]